MGTSINNSFLPDFSSMQAVAATANTSTDTTAQPVQGQGQVVTTGTTGSSAYASLQGSQTQNINITLGEALGATQNLSADPSSVSNNSDAQGTTNNTEEAPQVVNAGLSEDQQVTAQQGFKGQGSNTGSGDQSGQGQAVYMGTAASGLQKGQGAQSSAAATSMQATSNFTLKVDTADSSTLSTSTTQSSTSYVDSNGAPVLPPGPNVFGMIAESGELSSNLQLTTVDGMVAANKGMNSTLAQEYSKQISDIQNYISAKNSASSKSSAAQAFSWAINITMVVVGCATADPMLVGAGIAGCIMTADPNLSNQLAGALEQMFPGIPPELANVMATLIIVAGACVATGGVAAAGEMAADSTTVAARAAINASEGSIQDATANVASNALKSTAKNEVQASATSGVSSQSQAATIDSSNAQIASKEAKEVVQKEAFSQNGTFSDWANDTVRFKNAMATPEGRAAFQTSIKDQMVSGANSTWKNISEMSISNMIDTALNSLSNAGKNISDSAKNLGKNAYEAGASAIRVMSNPLEAMQTQIAAMSKVITKFAGHNSSAELSLAESASSAKAVSTSMAERTQQLIESVGSKLMNMQPQKVVQIAAELTMSGLTVTGGVMQYNATKLKGKAQEAQAGMLDSQAQATNLNQQIQLANSQINMVLGDMNSSIVGAGNALANMSSLSSETVGHLHGAAAA